MKRDKARLGSRQELDIRRWRQHVRYLEGFLADSAQADEAARLGIPARLDLARKHQGIVSDPAWLEHLRGTLGVQVP